MRLSLNLYLVKLIIIILDKLNYYEFDILNFVKTNIFLNLRLKIDRKNS